MNRGEGGWSLTLRCLTCSAEDVFKGVVLGLARDRAVAAGWTVGAQESVLRAAPEVRQEVCPKCTSALGG